MKLKEMIRLVPGFPTSGILYRDITPLLADAEAFNSAVTSLSIHYVYEDIDVVAGVEARGFIFGAAIAYQLGVGFIPIRKEGKLPFTTESVTYDLEYGSAMLEIHTDAIKEGERVLIVDDVLATGGTLRAAAALVERMGGVIVGACVLVEIAELEANVGGVEVFSLISSVGNVKW